MRTILIGTLVLALGTPIAALADESSKPDPIAGLIRALSSSKFTDREKADRELRRIGEPALKQLKEAAQSGDYEVRERAFAAIQVIQQRLENDKLLLAPKLRLQYDKTPLQDAIADLTKKTGIKYQLDPQGSKDPKQPLTLDTGEVAYWEAVEKFLAAAGLTEVVPTPPANAQGSQYYEFQARVQLRGGGLGRYRPPQQAVDTVVKLVESKSSLSAATSTLIRVKALPNEAVGSTVVKGSNQLMLHVEVTPAPSLLWQGVVNVDIRKVVDDRGIVLAQSHTNNPLDGANNTVWMNGIQVIQQGQVQIVIQGGVGNEVWTTGGLPGPGQAPNPRHVPIALLAKDSNVKTLKESKASSRPKYSRS